MAIPYSQALTSASALDSSPWSLLRGTFEAGYAEGCTAYPGGSISATMLLESANNFNDDQSAIWTFGRNSGLTIMSAGPAVRMSGTGAADMACYACVMYGDGTSLRIVKRSGGTTTTLASVTGSLAVNDTLMCRVAGSTIELLKNGDLLGSTTDSSITTGQPGLVAYGSDNFTFRWNTYVADNYTAPVGGISKSTKSLLLGVG